MPGEKKLGLRPYNHSDPEKFRKALITSVASSTAIETGAPVASIARMLEDAAQAKPFTPTQDSAR